MSRVFVHLTRLAQRHAPAVLASWLLLAGALFLTAPSLTEVGVQDQSTFLPRGAQSQQAVALLAERFPEDPSTNGAVVVLERDGGLLPADRAYAAELAASLQEQARRPGAETSAVLAAGLDARLAPLLRSSDGQAELLVVGFRTSAFSDRALEAVEHLRADLSRGPDGLNRQVTGLGGLAADQDRALKESFDRVGVVTLVLVVGILLAVYRSPVAAAIPLLTIGVAFVVAQSLVALLAQAGLQVASLAATFMVVLVFGAGTDYCLFLLSRFRDDLSPGDTAQQTLRRAADVTSGVIVASGAAVAIGFLAQLTADFGFYRTMGPAIGLAIVVTVFASLTLTPALVTLAGRRVFWPLSLPTLQARPSAASPRWTRLGALVRQWPAEVALAAVIPMVLLSAGLAAVQTSTDLLGELPADSGARRGAAVIAEHFPAGAAAPLSVLVSAPEPLASDGRLSAVDRLTDELRQVPGVAEVRSATQPAGAPLTARGGPGQAAALADLGLDPNKVDVTPLYNALASPAGLRLTEDVVRRYPQLAESVALFNGRGGATTRIVVVLDTPPFGAQAQDTARRVSVEARRILTGTELSGATVAVAGPAAVFGDIEQTATRDFFGIAVVLALAIALVLAALLRALLLPVLLVLTALLSYTAALGFAAVVGRFVLGQDGVAFYLPAFLMVILVALGSDYNIFITGRIREERDAGASPHEAAVRALVATGPVISNAGLILAGTFAALALAPIPTLQLVGIAVAFGVLLDTFVVRPLLVPALVVLLGRRAFWPDTAPAAAGVRTGRRLQAAGMAVGATCLTLAFGLTLQSGTAGAVLPAVPTAQAQRLNDAAPPAQTTTPAPSGQPRATSSPSAAGAAAAPRPAAATPKQPAAAAPRATAPAAAAPAAPPRRTAPAAGPSRVAPPATGNWLYTVKGTRKVGAAGSEQPFQEDATTVVTRTGGSDDAPQFRLRTETNGGSQQQDRRYAPQRVQLLATDISSAGVAYGGTFEPPQDLIRWPVRTGESWSSDWTLGSVSGRTESTVRGTRQVTVGSARYTCYEISSRTTFRGDAQGTQTTDACWVAELGMTAVERQVFRGSYNGIPFDSDSTATLLQGP